MPKIAGSGSASGSGSISHRHGSADPNPHQNVMDPEHWLKRTASLKRNSHVGYLNVMVRYQNPWIKSKQVFRIRKVLVQIRIQIRGHVPLITDPDPTYFFNANKMTRKKNSFFCLISGSYRIVGTLTPVFENKTYVKVTILII
jgi:hypothetical protein